MKKNRKSFAKLRKAEKRKRQKEAKKLRKQTEVKPELNTEEPNGTLDEPAKKAEPEAKAPPPSQSDIKLKLNIPMKLNIDLYDDLEFFCDNCPVELNGYTAATNHVLDFGHNQMSVSYNSLSESIKCQSCGVNDLSLLNAIMLTKSTLSLSCNKCLENNGLSPSIYSLSRENTLLKYVDNMYRLVSMKCFSCGSEENLAVDEDLTCYCEICVQKDPDLRNAKLVKRTDDNFLATYFEDETYNQFKNIIDLGGATTSTRPEGSPDNLEPENKPEAESSKKDNKKGRKDNKEKTEKKDATKSSDANSTSEIKTMDNKGKGKKSKKQKNSKDKPSTPDQPKSNVSKTPNQEFIPKGPKSTKKDLPATIPKGPKSSFIASNRPSESLLNSLSSSEIKVETKFEKLKEIVRNTLPSNIKLKFNTMTEYNNYLSYSLFLEELYTNDICTDVEFSWNSFDECTMFGSTKTWFDMYVNDDVHHLKKHPFVRDQSIFIVSKSDADLNWTTQPEFWLAHIASSTLAKVNKRGKAIKSRPAKHAVLKKSNQLSSFNLKLYSWNDVKFPINERGDQFAFLPASPVVTRILNSMNKIENKAFINLILGKEPVKRIKFDNKIGKYFNVLNDSQKRALQSALNNQVTILQGPPGSGKTSTIYEIILQLLSQLRYYPILVVAASNLAVDNIAEKLMANNKDIILRITSLSKEKEYTEDHPLGSVCLHNKISKILPPNLQDIERRLKRNSSSVSSAEFSKYLDACSKYGIQFINQANIIFATTAGIAGPYLKKIKKMPVIIMDEATQSSEPSTLIPLGAQGCSKVIFVGDTAQLSVFTRVKSLEMSLFQRVLENGTYEDPFMLDTQYRMHPDISHFSRMKFYDNKLKDGITEKDRQMKGIKYPVYFFDHQGIGAMEDKMFSVSGEEFGFSWVNRKEVSYIERMLEKLIVDHQVPPSTIGVMTGYAAQRDLIVKALERNNVINPNGSKTRQTVDKEDLSEKKNVTVCNVNGIIVATVDAFQGREMNFVLLSCVRSNQNGSIGFMSDKRRMNVALTRAKYSFIICGNAQCMSTNALWRQYIAELKSKGYVKKSLNEY